MHPLSTSSRGSLLNIGLLVLLSAPAVLAQGLPDLKTATEAANNNDDASTSASTGSQTSGKSATTATSTGKTSGKSTASSDSASTATSASSSSANTAAVTNAPSLSSSVSSFSLQSGFPTIAGAGIPTMIVPNTKSAPYMQKSSVPEGTFFIAVGAVLGFLGFMVIAWRAMVAWSVERSVKRAALASVMATDDKTGWPTNPFKSSEPVYSQAPKGSSLSLDALTSAGKPVATARAVPGRQNRPLIPSGGSGLFFSPTASIVQGQNNSTMPSIGVQGSRSSSYLPAGYYANPAAQVGTGAQQSTGRSTSAMHSPPHSPERGGAPRRQHNGNRLVVGAANRDSQRLSSLSATRPISALVPHNGLSSQPSNSSLTVGTGHEEGHHTGQRAPSAYLDDLFGGSGPQNGATR